LKVVSIKISEKLLKKLDLFCEKNNITRSEAIRIAIELLLKKGYVKKLKPVK